MLFKGGQEFLLPIFVFLPLQKNERPFRAKVTEYNCNATMSEVKLHEESKNDTKSSRKVTVGIENAEIVACLTENAYRFRLPVNESTSIFMKMVSGCIIEIPGPL